MAVLVRWKTWVLEKLIKALASSISHSAKGKWRIWLMNRWCQLKQACVPAGIWQDKPPQRDVGIACDLAKNHWAAAWKGVDPAATYLKGVMISYDFMIWKANVWPTAMDCMECMDLWIDDLIWFVDFVGMIHQFSLMGCGLHGAFSFPTWELCSVAMRQWTHLHRAVCELRHVIRLRCLRNAPLLCRVARHFIFHQSRSSHRSQI